MGEQTRFRLSRCGVVNVWQYDRQVFDLADGRLLLRGANGAGKSKTMEMILPFAIDGDKARLTASGRHHTSLLWLLLDGYDGQARTGYVWVEFTHTAEDGEVETFTCGVGMRATASARAATAWYFTSPRRVGVDLHLEDHAGPLSRQQLEAEVTGDGRGHVFEQAVRYREHVGQQLFGLPSDQYDDLLRLIYWLRQPQVGEDIDPRRLAEQLVNALPQVDDAALRTAGDTFDELEAFGEQIERRARAAQALDRFADTYGSYARGVVHERGSALLGADSELRRRTAAVRAVEAELTDATQERDRTGEEAARARNLADAAHARIGALESGPEWRARARLLEMGRTVGALGEVAAIAKRQLEASTARAGDSARTAEDEAAGLTDAAGALAADLREAVRALDDVGAQADAAVLARTAPLAGAAELLGWANGGSPQVLADALQAATDWLAVGSAAVTRRQAAVTVVRAALDAATEARRTADDAAAREAEAQVRVDGARTLLEEAVGLARAAEEAFATAVSHWHSVAPGPSFELPALDPDGLRRLDDLARGAVASRLDELSASAARAGTEAERAAAERDELTAERAEVAAQVDPEPVPPHWARDDRDGREGAPFWKLVDFTDDLDATARAGLEAALEGAGVLDAWVSPDGRVRGDRLDVELDGRLDGWPDGPEDDGAGAPETGAPETGTPSGAATLARVLRVDEASTAVPPRLITALLQRISLLPNAVGRTSDDMAGGATGGARAGHPAGPGLDVAVGVDGGWRAGPVHGRTAKATAQYVGAAARVAERSRRLERLDAAIAEAEQRRSDAAGRAEVATDELGRVRAWLVARPGYDDVTVAWATLEEREATSGRLEAERSTLAAAARDARTDAAARQDELVAVGDAHGLPVTADGLRAREEALRAVAAELAECSRVVPAIHRSLTRWLRQAEAARADAATLVAAGEEEEVARAEWTSRRQEHEALLAAEGASVAELEDRLSGLRREVTDHRGASTRLSGLHTELVGRVGGLEATLTAARTQMEQARPGVDAAREALAGLDDLPGVTTAAFGQNVPAVDDGWAQPESDDDDATDHPSDVPHLATLSTSAVRRLVAELQVPTGADRRERERNAVQESARDLQSGEAAVHEPRLLESAGVLVAVGRDDLGELPLVELHRRLEASVAHDRELLTARERKLFEDHVLGQLGDALRGVRRKADELVHAMNEQLRDVTTSQGIRVRLRWRLRDDIAPEARRAVELLGQPIGALLPDERTELRESLHRLIDVSRAEAPEESYAVHLARALDYRQWNAFTVQYHRPETGDWRDLQRRTALSQGEQKVLCYLPLFAAAAAHFTSVAGAAPHAPRFVLLDDAFPKIDVRTHPLLFGLLVDLDLDFVITSERLWGTHATVPTLAIYEALRHPGERGIAQYQHRWDGHRLTTVGA